MKKDADDTETALASLSEKVILDIIERDIGVRPERLQPITAEQFAPWPLVQSPDGGSCRWPSVRLRPPGWWPD